MLKFNGDLRVIGIAMLAGLAAATSAAGAEPLLNSVQLGVGSLAFNTKSGYMSGPPGTTPDGAQADVKDRTAWAFLYERRISGPWSIAFQAGVPPVVTMKGAGTAAPLGEIGSVRAWFPAILGNYNWEPMRSLTLHAGAGLHYTFFTDGSANNVYNSAFGGTSTRVHFSSSVGPVIKMGASWSLDRSWFVDFSYNRYWIRTTATATTDTPGLGDITRKVTVRTSPDVFVLTLGYRF
jgi:outer membrane protein